MADTVRLGAPVPALELTIRRRSVQAFALEVSTDAGPLVVDGAVVLEVEPVRPAPLPGLPPFGVPDVPLLFAGSAEGSVVTWQLDEVDSDLPFGQRWAALVLLPSSGAGRQVWARGSVWVR